jgi:PqqD family protein of HPr-rel-A system
LSDHPAASFAYRPRKRAGVLALDMGDGVVIYNDHSNLVHHLNPSAGLVWQLCDGDATAAQLAAEISEELGLDRAQVDAMVDSAIEELDALGLIEDASEMSRLEAGA